MKTETIFFIVGVLFLIATILYFTWEYLFNLSRGMKVIAIGALVLFFWFMANYLKERDL